MSHTISQRRSLARRNQTVNPKANRHHQFAIPAWYLTPGPPIQFSGRFAFTRSRQWRELLDLRQYPGSHSRCPSREEEHTVDLHLAVCDHLLDLSLLLEVLEALACERAVDLESVDEGGDGNEAVRLDVLVELVGSGLVKEDGVLGLVLNCDAKPRQSIVVASIQHRKNSLTLSLGPLLLLLLSTSIGGSHFECMCG